MLKAEWNVHGCGAICFSTSERQACADKYALSMGRRVAGKGSGHSGALFRLN